MMELISIVSGATGAMLGAATTVVSEVVFSIFAGLFSRLPDGGGFPTGVHDAAVYFGNMLSKVSFILPTDVLLSCLILIITVKLGIWGFHLALVIVNFIRGVPTAPMDNSMLPEDGPGQRYINHKGKKIYL